MCFLLEHSSTMQFRRGTIVLSLAAVIFRVTTAQYMGDTSAGQYSGAVGAGAPGQAYQGGQVSVGQKQPYVDPNKIQPGYFVPLQYSVNVRPITGYNNTATCNFDKKCFQYSEGCTFVNCKPFNRSSPVTCEECLNLCLSQQNASWPYCCKAVVYDVQYRICDLFSQDAGGSMANLAKRPGHIYFQPTGLCQASTAATVPPPAAICPSGQVEKMVAIKDYQLPGVTGQTVPNTADSNACARSCLSNKLADGTAFACKSAQFANGQCTLSTSQTTAEGNLQKAPGSTYLQKLCFPAATVAGCGDIFEEVPQMILVGQSRQIVDATSVTDCLQSCLTAQGKYGFACASAMYFANTTTQNCILNSESKVTKPDVFTQTDADKVFYLETGCGAGGTATGPVNGTGAGNTTQRFRDQSPLSKSTSDQWTAWTACVASVQLQFRYRHCSQQDPSKCEKQQRPCETADAADSGPVLWGRTSSNNEKGGPTQSQPGGTLWGRTRRAAAAAAQAIGNRIRRDDPTRQAWN